MSSKLDLETVNLTCPRCGKPFQRRYGTYRRNPNGMLCNACRGLARKEQRAAMPEAEREAYLQSMREKISAGWKKQSPEKKAQISQMRKKNWENPERKDAHAKMLSNRWANMSEEEKQLQQQKMSDGRAKFWADPRNWMEQSQRAREKWYNQSQEEQDRILKALETGRLEYYANATDEEIREMRKKQGEGLKHYWDNLSPEERESRIANWQEKRAECMRLQDDPSFQNEIEFMNYLNRYRFQYTYIWKNETKSDMFDAFFPSNPYRDGSISPYHLWDFKVDTLDGPILVDIDGSIHNPAITSNVVHDKCGNVYVLGEYMQFKDSQRPYQTDGYPAYIVICWDDHLTDETLVYSMNTGETFPLKTFIDLLIWHNMTEKERKELIQQ